MTTATETIGPQSTMQEVLEVYPGAQRALFRRYHIGGCASCGFQPAETLEQVCGRNNSLNVDEVLEQIKTSHEQDAKILISAKELAEMLERDKSVKLLDVRSREEYDTVQIAGSILMSQPTMQEILGKWQRHEVFVIIDHVGKQGLDAAAYFLGHGFENVRCLRGGIDAWSQEIDPKLSRYRLG
jgi:rhodanese-related sulfurtransferase